MKKFLTLMLALLFVTTLASCGQTDNTSVTETSSQETSTAAKEEVLTTNKQGFIHFTHDFKDGWTIDKNRSTDVCLCADYSENETDKAEFVLSVSKYDDGGSEDKARSIAHFVKARESSSGDVAEKKFGGFTFYSVCFDSYDHNGKRLCNMFGQTMPSEDGTYYFIEISIDNMSSDSLLQKIDDDLKTLKFEF